MSSSVAEFCLLLRANGISEAVVAQLEHEQVDAVAFNMLGPHERSALGVDAIVLTAIEQCCRGTPATGAHLLFGGGVPSSPGPRAPPPPVPQSRGLAPEQPLEPPGTRASLESRVSPPPEVTASQLRQLNDELVAVNQRLRTEVQELKSLLDQRLDEHARATERQFADLQRQIAQLSAQQQQPRAQLHHSYFEPASMPPSRGSAAHPSRAVPPFVQEHTPSRAEFEHLRAAVASSNRRDFTRSQFPGQPPSPPSQRDLWQLLRRRGMSDVEIEEYLKQTRFM